MITTVRIMAVEEARHVAKKLTPEEIGTALGRLARRIDQWKETKAELLSEAERLSALARGLVSELQGTVGDATAVVRPRRGGRPKGMKVSEATKAKLRAAWKRRKAAAAAAARGAASASTTTASTKSSAKARRGGRPRGMKLSEETRAKLRAAWKRRKAAAKRTA
jgi:hypothetical protein